MPKRVEVFADITCPFTHAGLKRVCNQLAELDRDVVLVVRAWPLEWVNGEPMDAAHVAEKVAVLEQQLHVDDFRGFRAETWPSTTIPALNLAAAAALVDDETGLAVSLALRSALFERGLDVSDLEVLGTIAAEHGLAAPAADAHPQVEADYAEGKRRGVRGSPDFWVGETEFFCPALDLHRDPEGALVAGFDPTGLDAFITAAVS